MSFVVLGGCDATVDGPCVRRRRRCGGDRAQVSFLDVRAVGRFPAPVLVVEHSLDPRPGPRSTKWLEASGWSWSNRRRDCAFRVRLMLGQAVHFRTPHNKHPCSPAPNQRQPEQDEPGIDLVQHVEVLVAPVACARCGLIAVVDVPNPGPGTLSPASPRQLEAYIAHLRPAARQVARGRGVRRRVGVPLQRDRAVHAEACERHRRV